MKSVAAVPSAPGYPLYSRLSNPVFARSLIRRFTHEGVIGQFTTSDILPSEIRRTGSEVVMRRAPEAEIFDYQKNQSLTHSTLDTDVIKFLVDRAKYYSLKLDTVDVTQIDDSSKLVDEFRTDANTKLDNKFSQEVLAQVPHEVSPFNKGRCAGIRTGSYNLGRMGAPVTINARNLSLYMGMARAVLGEQDVPMSDLFMTLPPAAEMLFYDADSPYASVCNTGDRQSPLLTGMKYTSLMGFDLIISNNSVPYVDPLANNQMTYIALFGRKDAIAFVTQLTQSRHITQDPNHFGEYWQGLQVYGFKVIRPEAVGVLYFTISYSVE